MNSQLSCASVLSNKLKHGERRPPLKSATLYLGDSGITCDSETFYRNVDVKSNVESTNGSVKRAERPSNTRT